MAFGVVWDSVRELLRNGELADGIELIEKWLKGRLEGPRKEKVRDWLDELTLHFSSAKAVQIEARKGTTTKEEAGVQFRQITRSVLALVSEIESADLPTSPMPTMEGPRLPDGKLEKIIGDRSDLQMVSWLERGLECSTGVCRLVSRRSLGTGFRINRTLLMTNNHVIKDAAEANSFVAQFFFEEGLDRKMREPVVVKLDPQRFWTSELFDITIVGADLADADTKNAIASLSLSYRFDTTVGDSVSIIQHPLGGPKQIALTSNQVVNIFDHRIQYVTDTMPGSSGAPVFNMSWEVVAVHHAGGDLVRNDRGEPIFANEGISIAAIAELPEPKRLLFAS
jgi:V8-like Glu-specific endopeptidase